MELYAAVRRSVYVEGLSERAAARRFGLARETVRKMLRDRRPPGYRRAQPVRRPKLDAFTGIIDQILREDQSRPKKQRHTAKRIGERLRAEYGFMRIPDDREHRFQSNVNTDSGHVEQRFQEGEHGFRGT